MARPLAQPRTGTPPPATSGLYRATVTRVSGGQTFLRIERGADPGREYGPVLSIAGITAGARVLVGFIEGSPDDVAIVREM